jgi:hypothetical protein
VSIDPFAFVSLLMCEVVRMVSHFTAMV